MIATLSSFTARGRAAQRERTARRIAAKLGIAVPATGEA
jgi:hypothetical protein